MQFSSKDIQLFNESGIHVEDKNYTNDEVERLKIKVTDFIVSQSTKDIDKYSKKFSSFNRIFFNMIKTIRKSFWHTIFIKFKITINMT